MLTLDILRIIVPTIKISLLLITFLVRSLSRLNDSVSGYKPVKEGDKDVFEPRKRPRPFLLLLPLLAVTLTFFGDGGLLIYTPLATEKRPEIGIFYAFASLSVYWTCSVLLLRGEQTDHLLIFLITGLSVVGQIGILVARILWKAQEDPFPIQAILHILLDAVRVCLVLLMAAAFLPIMAELPDSFAAEQETKENDNTDASGKKMPIRRSYGPIAILQRVKRLLPYLVPLRRRAMQFLVATCLLTMIIERALNILIPIQAGIVISDLAEGRSPWRGIIIWILLRLFSDGLPTLRGAIWQPVELTSSREIALMSFTHVLDLSMTFHNSKRTGEVMNVLDRADSASEFLSAVLFNLSPVFLDIGAAIVYLWVAYGLELVCIIFATGILYLGITASFQSAKNKLRSLRNEAVDSRNALKNESIANTDLVKYFSAERFELNRFRESTLKEQHISYEYKIYDLGIDLTQHLVVHAGILIGCLMVAQEIATGKKPFGMFVTFSTYCADLLSNIQVLSWIGPYTSSLVVDTDKLCDLLDEKTDILDAPDAVELSDCKGAIEFSDVTFSYGKELGAVRAVQDISFRVEPGQHVALVGETGAGKSTLFKLLFRFFEVGGGSIKIDGTDIRNLTQRSLRQSLGIVSQEGALFNDTISANIRYGDISASDEAVERAAKAAQLHDRIQKWPQKYETVVGERGVKLSGGEKQRVSIARTILKNAEILLLDEATSALDTGTEREIQGQLRKLTEGRTTLAIAHRLSTISSADLILVMKDGRIVEKGSHAELLKAPSGQYAALWNAQIKCGASTAHDESSLTGLAQSDR